MDDLSFDGVVLFPDNPLAYPENFAHRVSNLDSLRSARIRPISFDSRAVLGTSCLNLQSHGCLVVAKCAPFESAGITADCRKQVAVLSAFSEFSARSLDRQVALPSQIF